jgi:hypothetical protein
MPNTKQTRTAIGDWLTVLDTRRGRYLFPNAASRRNPTCRRGEYARIVHRWVDRAFVA